MIQSGFSFLVVSILVRLCVSQESGWIAGQVNTTMCYWMNPRAAVIRDTLFIDGGYLWWKPGMTDGTYGGYISDGNPLGLIYRLNFSTPFNTSQNLSSTFTTISKASGGGAANNIGPNYYDGAMFANDYGWVTYGGLLALTDAFRPPAVGGIAAYEMYASVPSEQFQSGYILDQLPDGVSRYVSDGASVSVPSENLGFYFGGLRSTSWGPIYYLPGPENESLSANQQSLTLVELDMTIQKQKSWKNYTLPIEVPGRASAEIVWVPVSTKGILVAIGGVIYPAYSSVNQKNNASANAASQEQSPTFMSTVSVYDIANRVWYDQDTTGAPGALAQGCTVLASAQDGSSHNIYWYGGFDGLHLTNDFSDDVWVLSLPSFRWAKISTGTASHARAGHRCTKPYPDQMMVIGGYSSLSGGQPRCLGGGIIQIFNLSSAEWINSYDPGIWSNYTVPTTIYQMIGGTASGGATQALPSPSGFTNTTMSALFNAAYNTSKVANWYPYAASPTASNTHTTLLYTPVAHKSGTPKYLAPALGAVLGIVFSLALIFLALFLLWRRRTSSANRASANGGTEATERKFWDMKWLGGTSNEECSNSSAVEVSVGSDKAERPNLPELGDARDGHINEMGTDTGRVYEMMAPLGPVELHDTSGGSLKESINGDHGDDITSVLSCEPEFDTTISPLTSPHRVENSSFHLGLRPGGAAGDELERDCAKE